jgi:CheY-like chemotaxis protein
MRVQKILVADDEPDVLESLKFRLLLEGYEVATAADGLEALGAARSGQPDLVLLDVMMPRENGYRIARLLREDEARGVYPEGLRIVLLTARNLASDPDRERIFLEFSRADLMLYKPFDLELLVEQIARLLAGGPVEAAQSALAS